MKSRFDGATGRRVLVEVLRAQRLVEHDVAIAEKLATDGQLVMFAPGDVLIEQNSTDNDVYFIIEGDATVLVNGRPVATRGPSDSVGEMAIVDGSARRSASIIAQRELCALKLTESQFCELAESHPRVWRTVAKVVAERLRQRTQFHEPPNDVPVLFVGSSVEGLPVAKHIQLGLKHSKLVVQLWTAGVFGPGGVTVDSLFDQVQRADFAVFVFGPDDRVISRHVAYLAPRDNVVFELGLFMGRLDRNRCYVVREHATDIKIPSDLLGITQLTYVARSSVEVAAAVSTVCTELEDAVGRLGVK